MKTSRLSGLFRHFGIFSYLMMSKIHWNARERAITNMLSKLLEVFDGKRFRVVDIGCGPGLLAKVIKEKGLDYLGIDSNPYAVQYCEDAYPDESGITFLLNNAENGPLHFSDHDIVTLNGAAHHLDDSQMESLLKNISHCFAIIIADHLRKSTNLSLSNILPFVLQRLDRGKFIRPFKYFEHLDNYTLHHSEEFPIGVAGITCWTYFCNCYISNSIYNSLVHSCPKTVFSK